MNRWRAVMGLVTAIAVVLGASIVRYHHALAVFLKAGQPTGCGGG